MQKYARMGVIGGIVAVLALAAVAFAVASGDSGAPPRDDVALQADDSATPTSAPDTEAPTVTPTAAPETEAPTATPLDGGQDGLNGETTTALNPAGHCVELPNTSDVIQDPDQHDNWTVTECDPQNDGSDNGDDANETPDAEEPDDQGDDDGQSEELVPATNPGGECTQIGADSDVAKHPEKHPGWSLGECEDSGD